MSSAFHRQFEDQLGRLKLLAAEFARDNPALAPMLLGSGSDPDVERLLEGTAFLTSLLRSRLDDAFPEFVQDLTRLLLPHYLLPTPSSAMMVYRVMLHLTSDGILIGARRIALQDAAQALFVH